MRSGRVLLALAVGLVALAALGTGTARAWYADGVTVEAVCDGDSGTYTVSATIQQSDAWPDAFVQSITPSSFPGDTSGQQTVTVVIGWNDSQDTQTFTETVTLGGDCGKVPKDGTLTVIKHVDNGNGGSASAGDFNMNVAGPTPLSFAGAESPGTTNSVSPGDYTVTESGGPSDYTLTYSGDCDSSGHVNVGAGQSATCTLTNTHQAPRPATIVVKKVMVGGTDSFDFSGTPGGTISQNGGTISSSVAPGQYTSTEAAKAGWDLSSISCDTEGSSGNVGTRTATFNVQAGQTVICTFTNTKKVVVAGHGSISVSKSADPTSLKEPGGPVTFSVSITNTSNVDVTIQNVVDDKFGDLDDEGGSGCFDVPITLHPGESVSCQFTEEITGVGGTSHTDTVTASGTDENGNPVSASDDATVVITPRLIDLVIDKQATSPTPLNGIVHYHMTVTNKGPDTATNVQLADPAPAGITYLTASPSQGTCTATPALITCSLGSIAAGQTVTIDATGRATTVGSHTNTATVTGEGGHEANPGDNVASAVTIVPAPTTPPTPKPTPKPKPQPCLALTVTPKMITADGTSDRVVAKVTAGSRPVKGAKVVVQGAGVHQSGRTNAAGIVVIRVNPRKAGLITITTPETHHSCGPRRIGVVGVFLPPLTG